MTDPDLVLSYFRELRADIAKVNLRLDRLELRMTSFEQRMDDRFSRIDDRFATMNAAIVDAMATRLTTNAYVVNVSERHAREIAAINVRIAELDEEIDEITRNRGV